MSSPAWRHPKCGARPCNCHERGTLKIAWWLGGRLVRGRAFVIVGPREGELLQDLFAGLVYLAAAFAIIAYVFDLPIQGSLATSGAIAIVLGLALQSTRGDFHRSIKLQQ
jgi:small-conductance mechanosensitive channel